MDILKAFGCIDHKLLITKLYGCFIVCLKYNFLLPETQPAKINDWFSGRLNIEYGVPQGSILDPIIFNINTIDLFYKCEEHDIKKYADDTTPYSCTTDIPTVISKLQV